MSGLKVEGRMLEKYGLKWVSNNTERTVRVLLHLPVSERVTHHPRLGGCLFSENS